MSQVNSNTFMLISITITDTITVRQMQIDYLACQVFLINSQWCEK